MRRRYNVLFFFALTAITLVCIIGCTQPDDIVAPVSTTRIILTPDRLPTLPGDLFYHVWAIDTTEKAYSIGSFVWNNSLYRFYDTANTCIDSVWSTEYDILDPFYEYLCITVEKRGEMSTAPVLTVDSIGPIMLRDTIVDPEQKLMKMVFPIDLWAGTGFFCVETPTDGYTKDILTADSIDLFEAGGVWFCEYIYDAIYLTDTFRIGLDVSALNSEGVESNRDDFIVEDTLLDTLYFNCLEYDAEVTDSCIDSAEVTDTTEGYDFISEVIISVDSLLEIYYSEEEADTLRPSEVSDTVGITKIIKYTDSSYAMVDTLVLDTFIHSGITFEYIALPVNGTAETVYDTVTLFTLDTLASDLDAGDTVWIMEDTVFTIEPFMDYLHSSDASLTTVESTLVYVDKFLQSFEDGVDLTGTKWSYKGWVLSPYLSTDFYGSLTQPSWLPYMIDQELSPTDGGLITTGAFKSFWGPDDSNPHSDICRVPSVPGEDFIFNLPTGDSSIYLANPLSPYPYGTVMITLEPDDCSNDSTNFPLILFVGNIPSYANVSYPGAHSIRTDYGTLYRMTNWAMAVNGNPTGFPAVHLTIERE